jgi:hypothetical protein
MPRDRNPPRLWKRPERRNSEGRVTHDARWFILDGGRQFGTGCGPDDLGGAQRALADYINRKHLEEAQAGPKPTHQIPVADVLAIYAKEVAPKHADPKRTAHALRRLAKFFASKTLADINGPVCRDYARAQTTDTVARRDLEYLRAAINHHRHEGLHDRIVSIVTPDKRPPRERWLTRSEAARLLWAAWRYKRDPKLGGTGFYLKLGARYVVEWQGRPVKWINTVFSAAARDAELEGTVTPHTLRHTAATWLMQGGVDLWTAAGFLGMTVETVHQ